MGRVLYTYFSSHYLGEFYVKMICSLRIAVEFGSFVRLASEQSKQDFCLYTIISAMWELFVSAMCLDDHTFMYANSHEARDLQRYLPLDLST